MLVTNAVSSAVPMTFNINSNPHAVTLLKRNDAAKKRFQHSRRLLRLGLQALARDLLSRGPAAEALVRTLCRRIRHGRDQCELLSRSTGIDVRGLAREGSDRIPLCGEGEPLHHSHEEAARVRSRG